MAHHVPDHQQGAAEVEPDRLEPVPAHQGPGAHRQIAAGHLQIRVRAARLRHQRALQVHRGVLGGGQLPGMAEVHCRQAGREVDRRRLVVAESAPGAYGEHRAVDPVAGQQRNRDQVCAGALGEHHPLGEGVSAVHGAYGGRPVGRSRQQSHGPGLGHPVQPAVLGPQLHRDRVAQVAEQEAGQFLARGGLVETRPDLLGRGFHRPEPREQRLVLPRGPGGPPVMLRQDTSPARQPKKPFHQPEPSPARAPRVPGARITADRSSGRAVGCRAQSALAAQ